MLRRSLLVIVVLVMVGCSEGDPAEQSELGLKYAIGSGVPKDSEKAVYWYRKSANQGYAEAQLRLGRAYYNAEGVPKDDAMAVFWYRKSAEQGNCEAKHFLAGAYEAGEGVPQDLGKALSLYREVAESKCLYASTAQLAIGTAYFTGETVSYDPCEAYKWCLIAQTTNFVPKATPFIEEQRVRIGSFLTTDQITEAQRRAQEFLDKIGYQGNGAIH